MKPKTNDRRRVSLNEVMAKDYIPFLSGRPKREMTINANDVMNLKIALNTTGSIEEFISQV
jgi:hypothetical protein